MQKPELKTILAGLIICCLIAPLRFNIFGAPIILQSLAVFSMAAVLGRWHGVLISVLYLLLGALGLPVFAGFQSGFEKLLGPTAGFLWAFPLVSFYLGWECEKNTQGYFYYMIYFFRAHLMWLVAGLFVLYFSVEGVQVFSTVVRLLPDLLLKTALGGSLAYLLVQKLPSDTIRK